MLTISTDWTFVLCLLALSLSGSYQRKCRALVLEGGGDKGSFQAGALMGLVNTLPRQEVLWDVTTGVSIGAINSAALALFPPGKEQEAADWLERMW